MKKRLFRSENQKMVSGVLGGIAEYFDIDPTLIRLGFVLLTVFTTFFPGVLAYIIMAIVIPKNDGSEYNNQPPFYNDNNYQQPPFYTPPQSNQPPFHGNNDASNQENQNNQDNSPQN